MEKLDEESASKFINALIKSVQTLCHGYLEFSNGIDIIGHINLSVDKGSSLHYILEEKVCKNEENSTLFISNSFHAQNQKPDAKSKGKDSDAQSGSRCEERTNSADVSETGNLSAISSISSALTKSQEKFRSGHRDSENSHSKPHSSTAKRKSSDDQNDVRSAKSSHLSSSPSPVSHFLTHSPHGPSGSSSPMDSKPSRHMQVDDSVGTVLPQTAAVGGDNVSDLGVNLAGSVLERVDDHSNSDLPDRGDDSDGDLEVTFIKEEYVEGDLSTCQFENSGGQQYGRGTHQRASISEMTDASMYPVSHHHSASSTFVPSGHDMSAAQHYGPSTSSQPGTSGARGRQGHKSYTVGPMHHSSPHGRSERHGHQIMPKVVGGSHPQRAVTSSHPNLPQSSQSYGQHYQRSGASFQSFDLMAFSQVSDLNKSGSSSLFKCQWCGAEFKTRHGFRGHVRKNHSNDPNFRCKLCGKGFLMKGHYEGHMNMHNNVKTFECPKCSRRFAYKSSLNAHVKSCGWPLMAENKNWQEGDE